MKLGKALATGIAEEQPQVRDEELGLAEAGHAEEGQEAREIAAVVPDEVPVAR
ncbi:hypothetical protein GCM10027074_00090 [Streptomyces deserti]